MIVLARANFLIFDEPTNHLDVESIELLEDALMEFDGTILLISHDRELLRALVDRVWVLHGRRITDFPGGFAEWEAVSAEREHAAAVAASEEEALRRVHEKQKTRRGESDKESRRALKRAAEKRIEEAEREVGYLETRIGEITVLLADPDLYTTSDGKNRALAGGAELDSLRRKLDAALDEWTRATEEAEAAAR